MLAGCTFPVVRQCARAGGPIRENKVLTAAKMAAILKARSVRMGLRGDQTMLDGKGGLPTII